MLGFYDTFTGGACGGPFCGDWGAYIFPGSEPDRGQRHEGRAVRDPVHRRRERPPASTRSGIGGGDVVAVVGAGGKTTLVYALAAEARAAGLRVLVTTTTHMGTLPEATTGPVLRRRPTARSEAELARALARPRAARRSWAGASAPTSSRACAPERVDALARPARTWCWWRRTARAAAR